MTQSRAADVLRSAKEYIEQGWAKGTMARNMADYPVPIRSKNATCWCALGAVRRAVIDDNQSAEFHIESSYLAEYIDAIEALSESVENAYTSGDAATDEEIVTTYNDDVDTTKEDVLALFQKTIERLENGNA